MTDGTRQILIDVMSRLVEFQGYRATSTGKIVTESQFPKGSLYHHFPGGKQELAIEAVTQAGKLIENRIRDRLKNKKDPALAISDFISELAGLVERSRYRAGGPITTIALESAPEADELSRTCAKIYKEWEGVFAEKLKQNSKLKIEAKQIASVLVASIEGAILLSRTYRSGDPLRNLSTFIRKQLRST